MMKQQEEIQLVYEKYGTSMSGGCLPLLIQMPILFALYPVIQNIPTYVRGVREVYMRWLSRSWQQTGSRALWKKSEKQARFL